MVKLETLKPVAVKIHEVLTPQNFVAAVLSPYGVKYEFQTTTMCEHGIIAFLLLSSDCKTYFDIEISRTLMSFFAIYKHSLPTNQVKFF